MKRAEQAASGKQEEKATLSTSIGEIIEQAARRDKAMREQQAKKQAAVAIALR